MLLEGILDADQQKALEHALVMHTDAVWTLATRLDDDSDGTTMSDKLGPYPKGNASGILAGRSSRCRRLLYERYVQQRILEDCMVRAWDADHYGYS
jgi:hypothetical protein